jgi:hypothetical protein
MAPIAPRTSCLPRFDTRWVDRIGGGGGFPAGCDGDGGVARGEPTRWSSRCLPDLVRGFAGNERHTSAALPGFAQLQCFEANQVDGALRPTPSWFASPFGRRRFCATAPPTRRQSDYAQCALTPNHEGGCAHETVLGTLLSVGESGGLHRRPTGATTALVKETA